MFVESECEEEEGDLEYDRKALDEEVEMPLLESIAFTLTVSTTLDHRPARIPQVAVKSLFAQHREERGEQRDQEARIHESSGSDNITRRVCLDRWKGGGFVRDSGVVEGEKDCAEEGH